MELTQKYGMLSEFRFQTQLDNMQYQICHINAQRLFLKHVNDSQKHRSQLLAMQKAHLQRQMLREQHFKDQQERERDTKVEKLK